MKRDLTKITISDDAEGRMVLPEMPVTCLKRDEWSAASSHDIIRSSAQSSTPVLLILCFLVACHQLRCVHADSLSSSVWDHWWAYDGISGPDYWGLMNSDWSLCSKGRRQSPIDIQPDQLLYDPTLEPLQFVGNHINGTIQNTGRGVYLYVNQSFAANWKVIISKGPLSYNYTLHHVVIHYGKEDSKGSEHMIDGMSFAAEMQLYAFNSQLYSGWDDAETRPNGVAAVTVLLVIADFEHQSKVSTGVRIVTEALKVSASKGQAESVTGLSIADLLPQSAKHYLTYEGSLTQPSCSENVEWIILNKPLYVSSPDMSLIRNSITGFGDNFRPIQPLLRRCVRTNIDHFPGNPNEKGSTLNGSPSTANKKTTTSEKSCSINRFTSSYKSSRSSTTI